MQVTTTEQWIARAFFVSARLRARRCSSLEVPIRERQTEKSGIDMTLVEQIRSPSPSHGEEIIRTDQLTKVCSPEPKPEPKVPSNRDFCL